MKPPPLSIENPNNICSNTIELPDDILLHILTHLPVKNIHRLKCVSKHWKTLICSPPFLSAYLTLSPHLNRNPTWFVMDRDAVIPPSSGPYLNLSFSLTQPPNIIYLTISGLPLHLTQPEPPTLVNTSNGLVLLTTVTYRLYIANPVTNDWAELPHPTCGQINILNHLGLSAKLTPSGETKLVIIELQAPKDPTKEAATMLIFNSESGQWDKRAAYCRAGSPAWEDMWQVDGCVEANGRIFWVHLICGLLVLDDPFGERMELRFIPLPEETVRPIVLSETQEWLKPRFVYLVDGSVHLFVCLEEENYVWRLTDVENGEWSLLFQLRGRENFTTTVVAMSPVEAEVIVLTENEKTMLFDWKTGEVLGNGKRRKVVEGEERKYYHAVWLPIWPTPIPLSLGRTSAKEQGKIYFQKNKFKEAVFRQARSIKFDDQYSTSIFPYTSFPGEVILEILTRLPPKSIHRLKCLSKHWLSFICSHRFLFTYLSLCPQPSSWLLMDRAASFSPGSSPNASPNLSFSPSQPPNITNLTISGLPSRLTKPGPPTVITSSNGLILFSLTPFDRLYICNPVTCDWAPLPAPDCGEIRHIPRVALSAKLNPNCLDVSLVVIELQTSRSRKGATLLMYRSITGQWEARPTKFKAPSGVHYSYSVSAANGSFEVNGNLFWSDSSCGLTILDDPFGEKWELRSIPLPPNGPSNSLFVFPISGFVQCCVKQKRDLRIWRLNDVEKGKWGVLYEVDTSFGGIGMPDIRGLGISAFHPLDGDFSYWTGEDKVVVMKMGRVVEIVSYPKNAEKQGFYFPVLLPTWPTPLPLSLRATSAKENGNIYFKNKNFKEAIVYYSRSISCLPTATAYANRAAANFELGKYQEAEMDCSEALKIDQQYMKVYVRRAIVRKELGMVFKAKEDVEMALKLDGPHHEVLKLYAEINCLLEKEL